VESRGTRFIFRLLFLEEEEEEEDETVEEAQVALDLDEEDDLVDVVLLPLMRVLVAHGEVAEEET
jgi:hypothetical protein